MSLSLHFDIYILSSFSELLITHDRSLSFLNMCYTAARNFNKIGHMIVKSPMAALQTSTTKSEELRDARFPDIALS